jgi:hypothetical protein
MHVPARLEQLRRQEVAPVEIRTVRGDQVDLASGVAPHEHPGSDAPRRVAANDDDIAVATRPLALDSCEPPKDIEDQVAPFARHDGNVNADSALHCFVDERRLGNRPLSDPLSARYTAGYRADRTA